jgi:hypothetical protein
MRARGTRVTGDPMKTPKPSHEQANYDIGTEYAVAEIVKMLRSSGPTFTNTLLDSMRRIVSKSPGYRGGGEAEPTDSTPEGCADMILARMRVYAPAWREKVREALSQKLQAMTTKGQRKNREAKR